MSRPFLFDGHGGAKTHAAAAGVSATRRMAFGTAPRFDVARLLAGWSPRAHWAAALGALCLVAAAAVAAVWLIGDPRAASPRAVAAIGPGGGVIDAPRVSFADAAAPGLQPDAPQALPGGVAITVDPTLDAGVTPGAGAANGAAVGANASLRPGMAGPPPPTLDAFPDSPRTAARTASQPLARAPIAGLFERTPAGVLPIIAANGATPFQAYARPAATVGNRPTVSLIVGGLGFNARVTAMAIDELPAEVTLSFMPYTQGLQGWIDRARADGHEVLLEVPMESWDPRGDDTGPKALTTQASSAENIAQLEAVLSRASGYFGVMNYLGQRFVTAPDASEPVARALRARGLAMVGNGVGARSAFGQAAQRAGLPFRTADRLIDARRDAEAIDEQLLGLETAAQRGVSSLGVGFAFPVTIEQIKVWSQNLDERGIALAPASAAIAARMAR